MTAILIPFDEYSGYRNQSVDTMARELNLVKATVPVMVAWYFDDVLGQLASISAIPMSDTMLSDIMWLHDNNIYFETSTKHCAIFLFQEDHAALFKLARL